MKLIINDQAEESVNLLALYPDLLLWPPPETCSPHQSYVWEHFLEKRKKKKKAVKDDSHTPRDDQENRVIFHFLESVIITVENLLHSLVAHLSGSEALQRHDGGVGPVTQQQLAGLDVTSQRRSVKSCLTQSVHSIDLESEQMKFLSFIPTTLPKTTFFQKENAKANLCSMFLQHLKDIIVSSLGSDMQRGHEAKRRHR